MKLEEIIEIASVAYCPDEDDLITRAAEGEKVGDTLAEFCAIELRETYDATCSDEDQLNEACRVMQSGADELQAVADALYHRIASLEYRKQGIEIAILDAYAKNETERD